MDFLSDNAAGVHPAILAAVAEAAGPQPRGYDGDIWSERLDAAFSALFETQVKAFAVPSGTAANALGLAACVPPYGGVWCHAEAHVDVDEAGAVGFYTGGASLMLVPSHGGKLTVAALETAAARRRGDVHQVQAAALSLTQATECGTVYTPDEVAALSGWAKARGLAVQMDGARFANAVAHLGCSPADVTWRAGVDILSFGATKNGCMAAEAIVVFDEALADTIALRRKRAGHLFSKMRYLAAQLEAYLADDLWLGMARHANALALHLSQALAAVPGAKLAHKVEANEIFVELPEASIAALEQAGFAVYRWNGPGTRLLRLVVSWSSRAEDADRLAATALAAAPRIG